MIYWRIHTVDRTWLDLFSLAVVYASERTEKYCFIVGHLELKRVAHLSAFQCPPVLTPQELCFHIVWSWLLTAPWSLQGPRVALQLSNIIYKGPVRHWQEFQCLLLRSKDAEGMWLEMMRDNAKFRRIPATSASPSLLCIPVYTRGYEHVWHSFDLKILKVLHTF